MFSSIMIPLDGSTPAEHALRIGLSIARRTQAQVHLVQVRSGMPWAPIDDSELPEETYLHAVAEELASPEIQVQCVVLSEPLAALPSTQPTRAIADALRRYIETHGIQLVVMSSHGRGGIRRAWLGSVADALLRACPVPVIITRPQRRRTRPLRELPLDRILVSLDGSPSSEAAIEPALALARMTSGHVILVRCVEPVILPVSPHVHWVVPPDTALIELQQSEARAYLEKIASELRDGSVTVEVDVVLAPRVAGILQAARDHGVHLLAMATHGAGAARRFLIGSTADKVVRTAGIPVLTVRPAHVPLGFADAGDGAEAASAHGSSLSMR